jgi:hypothetical protein
MTGTLGDKRRFGRLTVGVTVAAVAAVAVPLLLRSFSPIESYDFWWHLKTGEEIVRTGQLPSTDPFSFTATGIAWVDHSWLFQVLIHLLHRIGGFPALGVLRLALVAAAVVIVGRHLWHRRVPAAATAAIVTACLWGACFRLTLRPDLVSVVFTAVLLFCLTRMRGPGEWKATAAAAGLLPLWANLHIGAVLAPLLIVPFCLEGILFPAPDRSRVEGSGTAVAAPRSGPALRYWALLVWSIPALAVNPWGWKPYAVVARITGITHQSYGANLEWARPEPADFPLFYLSLLLLVILPLWRRRIPDPPVFLAVGLLAAMGLSGIRFLGLYFIALPFLVAAFVPGVETAGVMPSRRSLRLATACALVAVALGAGFAGHIIFRHPFRSDFLRRERFPAGAVEFLATKGIPARRLFNDVKFGGYLVWSRFPQRRVFIDGRNEVYEDLLREVFTALGSAREWNALLDRYDIDSALLRYPPELMPVVYPATDGEPPRVDRRPFSTLYFPGEDWALVYWDDAAMLFLKRIPEHEIWIRQWEYVDLRPDDHRHLLHRARTEAGFREAVMDELGRKVAEDPECRRARSLQQAFAAVPPPPLTRNVQSPNNH